MIPVFEPDLSGNEAKYVADCMATGWISSQGAYILKFEEMLASFYGLKFGVAASNCTTALHLALKALDIGPGDEVVCPDLTFIAPANMIRLSGADLVLCDVDSQTLNLDPQRLEDCITPRTKAVVAVHQFGHAAPMDEILEIARRRDLRVIEDNAESPGGRYKGRLLGTFGDCSCYSFFANKIVTTGEGGALLTNSEEIADRSRMLRDHGMSKSKRYHHLDLGYNYRMTNLQAAVGVGQLERFEEILDSRARQMDWYYERLRSIDGVHVREFADWCSPVHWLTTIRLDDAMDRDAFLGSMRSAGVDCRQMVNPVHRAEHFKSDFDDRDFPQSINASEHSAHLPSALNLSEGQIDFICETVRKAVTKA